MLTPLFAYLHMGDGMTSDWENFLYKESRRGMGMKGYIGLFGKPSLWGTQELGVPG